MTRKGTQNWRVHPGEILREEFLKPMKLTVYQLAKELHVPAPRLNDVVLRKRGVSADTAIRLARFFGTSEQFWLGLQAAYEVSMAKKRCATKSIRSSPGKLMIVPPGPSRNSRRLPATKIHKNLLASVEIFRTLNSAN